MNRVNLTCVQGDTKRWDITIQTSGSPNVYDFTGKTFTGSIRTKHTQGQTLNYGPVVGQFTIENPAPHLGTFTLLLDKNTSRNLPVYGDKTEFAYDLQEATNGSPQEIITRILGTLIVYKDITQ